MKLVIDPHIFENAFTKENTVYEKLADELYVLFRVAKSYRESSQKEMASKLKSVQIFISYKWIDEDWMQIVRRNLERAKIAYWLDTERIGPGTVFRDEIKKEINKSTLFISIYSNYACESDGVFNAELSYALDQQRERKDSFIIPLLPEEIDIPQELDSRNAIYLSKSGWLEKIRKQVQVIIERRERLAAVRERLSKPEICLDDKSSTSQISLKYRQIYEGNEKFLDWVRRVDGIEGLDYVPSVIDCTLEDDLEKTGCLEKGDEVFIRTVFGARRGHFVSEGGVCKQHHTWDSCPMGERLRGLRQDFVYSANIAFLRAKQLREDLEKRIEELEQTQNRGS